MTSTHVTIGGKTIVRLLPETGELSPDLGVRLGNSRCRGHRAAVRATVGCSQIHLTKAGHAAMNAQNRER
jgi:hypothetical protein